MKTKSSLYSPYLGKLMLLCTIFFSTLAYSQTTIINYNFDVANITNYQKFYTRYVNGINCLLTSGDAYNQNLHAGTGSFAGTVTGANAYFANTASSPNRIVALSGSGTKYFNFQLTGSSLQAYSTFKIYFQARDNNTGTTTINSIQYSVDGGAFTSLASSIATTTSWQELYYSLPAISPTTSIDFRINFTNSASGSVFGVDNFQIQAVGPSTASVCIAPNHPIATNIYQNTTTNLIAGFRMDAHVSAITPTGVTLTTGGTYLTTDIVNFKLWQNSVNSIYGATQVGSTIATALSGSSISFSSGFTSFSASTSTYFFVTADVLLTAISGRTVNITSTVFTSFTFSGSPTKIGTTPVSTGNTFTVGTTLNKYTASTASGLWDNGSTVNRWATTSGGTYNGKWAQNAIANLETSGNTIQIDGTNGSIAQQINVTANNFNIQSTLTQVTVGITLTNTGIINVSGSNTLRLSNSAGGNGNGNPLLTSYGFRKEGTGELMFSQPFSIYSSCLQGPIYINGGTLTIGDKTNTNNPNLYIYDNDFYINNGKFTIAASTSSYASTGFLRSLTVDGTGSNNAAIELYNTGSSASLYCEPTTDDRYPQLAIDLVPISVKGTLSLGYGGNTTGVTNGFVLGNVKLTGDATFKTLTNGSGNLASSSGIIMNYELAGEGGRSGLAAAGSGSLGSFGITDNGYALIVNGGGGATSDGGYVSVNGSAGTSTGAWVVGKSDGSEAGYLSINDVGGMTSGSITVNQNSQLDINVSGATVSIAKTPTITLNGAKTYSYYGAMALYNSTSGTTSNTLSSPIVVKTTDATVAIYNNAWTLAGAISGTGGFQLYGNSSTYNLTLTSGSNTWSGGTKILSGILNVSSGSSISTGSLTMGQLSGFDTRLNLNNAAQTISSLSTTWINTTGTRSQVINLATNHILTINQSSNTTYGDGAVNTLTGIISGPGNLIKDGSGTLTLTGANTYTGLTQVKGGTLKLSGLYTTSVLPSTNNVHIIGGTLEIATNQTLNNVILSTGTLQVNNGITLTINGTLTLVNGSISLVGTGKIVYGASGTLTYAGSNAQTTSTLEIPSANGPKGITNDNNTNTGLTLSANIANLTGASYNNGWLDFNGKTLTGTGTFTSNGATGPYTFTGNTSTASSVITNASSTSSLGIGMRLTSASLASNTFIIYIDPLVPNTVTLNQVASATSTGVSVSASWRGGLKVSLPNGIGNGTASSHVQTTGGNVYNSGANYVFNPPTSGSIIFPAMPTVGTLNFSPAYDVYIQTGNGNKAILGTSQDLEIAHDLTLTSGLFVTGNNLITWDNAGTLTSPNKPYTTLSTAANNSYICTCTSSGGELSITQPFNGSKGFKIKSVGGSTDVYFPIGMNFSSANRMLLNNTGTSSDITVLLKTGDLKSTPGARVNRIWFVKASAASGVTATMKLFFTKKDWSTWPSGEDEVESGFLYNDIHLVQKDYSQNFINKSTGTDVSTVNFLSATYNNTEIYGQYNIGVSPDAVGAKNGINSFTRFGLLNEYILLPVTLTDIKAYQQGNNIQVNWVALNELNIDHYEVEKSGDAINFKTVGHSAALNNGMPQTSYAITDLSPFAGNNYYRIKIFAKDGTVSYSAIVSVNISGGKASIKVMPNPVHNRVVNMQLNNLKEGKYQLLLYNSVGQQVFSKTIEHSGGSSVQQLILTPAVKPGTYILKLYNETTNFGTGLIVN